MTRKESQGIDRFAERRKLKTLSPIIHHFPPPLQSPLLSFVWLVAFVVDWMPPFCGSLLRWRCPVANLFQREPEFLSFGFKQRLE